MTPPAELVATTLPRPVFARHTQRIAIQPIAAAAGIVGGDVALAMGSLLCVLILTNINAMPDGVNSFLSMRVTVKNMFLMAALLMAWPSVFRAFGLYDAFRLSTWLNEAKRVVAACSVGSCLAFVFPLTSISGRFPAADIGLFWIAVSSSTLAFRSLRRAVLIRQAMTPRRVVIVGTGHRGQKICEELLRRSEYDVVGFVDSSVDAVAAARPQLGTLDDLELLLMRQPIDEVFITLPVRSGYEDIQQAIRVCERAGVPVKYRADIFESSIAWPEYQRSPVITMQVAPNDARLILKRGLDLLGAAVAILLAAPLMLVIAAAVKLTSRGPVLYAQPRYGRGKRIFRMLKFRTMVADAEQLQDALEERNEMDGPVFKIRNDPRITPIGRFLRKTSLDELPQLWHVLTGEMSLVGPRPLPLRDVSRFTEPSDMRRFSVRPGLTCLWQISGRNDIGFAEWIRLDLAYIDNWSLLLDFYILAQTVPAVMRGAGAR